MDGNNKIQLFEDKRIRTAWDEDKQEWYFSIVDVVGVLTNSDYQTARNYWKVLKNRMKKEGNQSVTDCNQLKMKSTDGKYYSTDVADTEQLLPSLSHHRKLNRSSCGLPLLAANA